MTSRIANIAIDANEPQLLSDFWCAALGWVVHEVEAGVITIGTSEGSWPAIDLVPVPESKAGKNRLHLDLRADRSTQAQEVDRLLKLGARRVDVGQEPEVTWVVLADPEGNEFCVLERTVQQVVADSARA